MRENENSVMRIPYHIVVVVHICLLWNAYTSLESHAETKNYKYSGRHWFREKSSSSFF